MSNIDKRYLRDTSKKRFYPITSEECVIDSDGKSISTKLQEVDDTLTNIKETKQDKLNRIVTVSITPGSGNPSGDAEIVNGNLDITLKNIQGIQGARGERGPQGIPGPKGDTGSSVEFPFTLVNDLVSNDTESGLTAAMGAAIDNVNKTPISIPSGGNIIYHYINSSGNWTSNGYHRSLIIPVLPGQRYIATAKDDYDAVYAFLTSRAQTHTAGAAAPLVENTTITTIQSGKTVEIVIPETCICLCFRGCTSQAQYNQSLTLLCPGSLTLFEHIADVVDRLQENKALPCIAATGNGSTMASSDWLLGIIGGRSYKLHVLTPDASIDSITGGSGTPTLTVYFDDGDSIPLSSAAVAFRKEYTIEAPANATKMRYGVRCDVGESFMLSVELLNLDSGQSILSLNPASEFVPKTLAARKRLYSSSDTDNHYPLTFLHLSDIHGNWTNVSRFLEFANEYSNRLDDLINTGDTVIDHLSQGTSGYAAIEGVERIMNVIGNHDTRGDGGGMNWQDNIGLPAYNEFIAPYVSNWNVVQPENAATEGYCYYYKDYTSKEVRLVVVDIMAYDDTQDTWLKGVLASAITAKLHVVIAVHYAGARSSAEASTERVFDKVNCSYSTLVSFGGPSVNLTNYNTNAYKMTASVSEFLDNGGYFVGYIQGHYHADFVAKVNEDPRQLIYAISSSKAGELRDCNHVVGTRNQDEFQIISIEAHTQTSGDSTPDITLVKLFKVGANIDRYGRKKESICIDYKTGKTTEDRDDNGDVQYPYRVLDASASFSEQLTTQNTTYEIRDNFNLNGGEVAVPSGCTLKFAGGSISNGTLTTNPFIVDAPNSLSVLRGITFSNSYIANDTIYVDWFDFVTDGTTDNYVQFKRLEILMNNKACGNLVFGKGKTYALKTVTNYRTNAYAPNDSFGIRFLGCSGLDVDLNGSTIKQLSSNTPMSTIMAFHNCEASVHNGIIIGDRETHSYTEYTITGTSTTATDFEWNHGIVQAGGDLEIYNMNISYLCGDGVIVGGGKTGTDTSKHYHGHNYNIHDCEISYCGRNGITCHSSLAGSMEKVYVHHIGAYNNMPAYNPQSGIDFEFEDALGDKPTVTLSSLKIEDCTRRGLVVATDTYFTKFVCENSVFNRANLTVQNLKNENNGDCLFRNCDINVGSPEYASSKTQRNIGCGGRFVDCRLTGVTGITVYPNSFDGCVITTTTDTSGDLYDNGSVFPQGTSFSIPPTRNTVFNINAGLLQLYNNTDSFFGNTINFNVEGSSIRMANFKASSCSIITAFSTARSATNLGANPGNVEFVDCDIQWLGTQSDNIAGYSSAQKVTFSHCRLSNTRISPRMGWVMADNCIFNTCSIKPVSGGTTEATVISNSTLRNCTGHYTKKALYIGCSIFHDTESGKESKLGMGGSASTYGYDEFINCTVNARNFTNNTKATYSTFRNCVLDIDNSYLTGAKVYRSLVYSSVENNNTKALEFQDSTFVLNS